jgi:WD40 repeat protein
MMIDSNIYIWHREHASLIAVLQGHYGMVNCVSWNTKDPYMLISASDDHSIRIWGRRKLYIASSPSANGVSHSMNVDEASANAS